MKISPLQGYLFEEGLTLGTFLDLKLVKEIYFFDMTWKIQPLPFKCTKNWLDMTLMSVTT